MAYGTLQTDVLNTSTGIFSTNNAYLGIAKAWINFTGSSGTINSSFNVSSLTVNGTGDYTINFTTAMATATYALVANTVTQFSFGPYNDAASSYTTTSARIVSARYSSGNGTAVVGSVAVFSS